MVPRPVVPPLGLVAARQFADHDRAGLREQPALPQLRDHAIEAIGPLADLVEEQHVSGRRVEGVGCAERREQLRDRPAQIRPVKSPGTSTSTPGASNSPIGSVSHSARSNDARS